MVIKADADRIGFIFLSGWWIGCVCLSRNYRLFCFLNFHRDRHVCPHDNGIPNALYSAFGCQCVPCPANIRQQQDESEQPWNQLDWKDAQKDWGYAKAGCDFIHQ